MPLCRLASGWIDWRGNANLPEPSRARELGADAALLGARLRLPFVVFGGMVAFQSSPDFDATKIAYLIGTVVCLLGALAAEWRIRRSHEVALLAPWFGFAFALVILIGVSFGVSRIGGISITDWFRDVAAYGLFAAVPVFALDGYASLPRKALIGMLVIAGLLGGLSWAVEWLARRDILDLPFARLAFPSPQLPGLLYVFAIAVALTPGRRGRWAVLAGVVLALFLITGTRSSLLFLVGPVAMVVLAGRDRIRASLRPLASHAIVAAGAVLVFQIALTVAIAPAPGGSQPGAPSLDPASTPGSGVLGDRFGSLPDLVGNPGSDSSIRERIAQYRAAWGLFASSPIVGVGPGHSIDWIDVSGYPRSDYTADTPLVLPAKFGLLGLLVFVGFAVAYGSVARTAVRRNRRSAISLTLVGYGVLMIIGLPLGFFVEDKGTSLALILLLALTLAALRAPGNDQLETQIEGTAGPLAGPPQDG